MKKIVYIIALCFLSIAPSFASIEYNAEAQGIYNLIFDLKINKAQDELIDFKAKYPDNHVYLHLENYIDVITIFLSEESSRYKKLKGNKSKRLDALEKADKNSPYYKYIKADIELQWALVNLKFSEYLSAFMSVKRSYSLLEDNEEAYPYFLPNKKSLGVLHAIVGAIPSKYKWGVKLLSGMDGTIAQGQKELLGVIEQSKGTSFPFLKETYTLYSFISLHLNKESEYAWKMINQAGLNPTQSSMDCFVLSNLAMRSGRFKKAKEILKNKPIGHEYFAFHYLDYLEGLVALYQLDENADTYFLKFLENFKGINYIKEAYQKLAWHSLIIGDKDGYFEYLDYCKKEGNTKTGGDKNAHKEALKYSLPQVDLLKARILFDGGNYSLAQKTLSLTNDSVFNDDENLEFIYRKARVEDLLKNNTKAIKFYSETIEIGYDATDYYACNAALKLGEIYERLGDCPNAKKAFDTCIDIEPYDYARSLHAMAKAGLNRIKDCR